MSTEIIKKTSIVPKLILAVGGAAALAIGGYAVYNYAAGQTCSGSPGSPCYQYTQAYKTCLQNYISANQQFLTEDQAAGVGYTQEQITYLNNLQTCMNNAAGNIYKTTKSLNQPITQAIVAITSAFIAVMVARSLINAYTSLKLNTSSRVSGSDSASAARQAVLQDEFDNGNITVETASDFSYANESMTSDEVTNINDFIDTVTEDMTVEDSAIVTEYAAQSIDAVESATEEVDDELAGLFE